jgi:peptidoglycan/LPS O-acetylase OafA/YrhL
MQQKHFIQRFESLRGLAALMVAVMHTLMVPFQTSGVQVHIVSALRVLCNGRAAVSLFFVLSGFVLGLAIRRTEGGFVREYLRFTIRRVLRIWPAFLCLTLLLLAWLCFGKEWFPGITRWLDRAAGHEPWTLTSVKPLTWPFVLKNIFLLDPCLNLVTWTLKVEIGCSLLLPLLHWAVRGMSLRGKTLVLLALMVLACLGKWLLLVGFVRAEALVGDTILKYVFLFYLGYILPEAGPRCFEKLQARTSLNALAFLVALAMFLLPQSPEDLRLVQGLGAWLILAGILYGAPFRCFRMLDHPLAKFYGRISYSFYLWHDVVLVIVSRFFIFSIREASWGGNRLLFVFVLWATSTAVATGLAMVFYSFIEQPFIVLSRKICSRLTNTQNGSAQFAHPLPASEVTTVAAT